MWWFTLVLMLLTGLGFLYRGRPYRGWVVPGAIFLISWTVQGADPTPLFILVLAAFVALAVLFGVPGTRQSLVSGRIMALVAPMLPRISDTERAALEAGTVWWDADVFSGNPDWRKLLSVPAPRLTPEEQAFLDGPTEELCAMLDDYQIVRHGDLPPEVWGFIKRQGFWGMIIPKERGGMGFSALAHSAVVTKLSSRSVAASVSVMIPNSLGPAELLLHYGTDEQKDHYLPRLARGEEIPAFALTEPGAGSDAAGGSSEGVVCRGMFRGEDVLGMRLNWSKRYITLGPIATLLGLSFRLRDPEHLLGEVEDLGITCALIPTDLPGVEIGQRHDPLGVPFLNGPNFGHDVFVPLDFIIGGRERAGEGWRMLMESLASGRSIALPGLATAACETSARTAGAYATVREQFDLPIGRFEGIQAPLARIGGLAYIAGAARSMTAGAVDLGEKPSVISAMIKAYLTEFMRIAVNDAMDITAGAGISEGPRNILARNYRSLPIGITVEGANILTRSLIVYGQGAIRCHPWVQQEIHAVERHDLAAFDRAFWGHVGFMVSNKVRAWLLGLTDGRLMAPPLAGDLQEHFGRLTRYSAAFAFLSDACMISLGAKLKFMERLSGRMADAFSWMYLSSTVLKRYADDGQPDADTPFARWALEHAEHEIETALGGVLDNFPNRWLARAVSLVVFPLGRRRRAPGDRLMRQVARNMLDGHVGREHLSRDIYVPGPEDPALGRLEAALAKVVAAQPVEKKLHQAVKARRLARLPRLALADAGVEAGVITAAERDLVRAAFAAREDAVQVDAFDPEHLLRPEVIEEFRKAGS